MKTFSIGFGERSFDESAHARRVAEHFGTDHHEEVFTPRRHARRAADGRRRSSTSPSPTRRSCRRTCSRGSRASRVTVALGGDGSDELLAGLPDVPGGPRRAALPRCRACCTSDVVVPLADRLPVSTANFSLDFKVKRFLRGARRPRTTSTRDVARLLHAGGAGRAARRARRRPVRGAAAAAYAAAPTTRPARAPDLPVREDVPPGRHPRQGRPREHGVLARGAGAVPRRRARGVPRTRARRASSCGGFDTKHLLKRAMADVLPPGIATRPKKGFGIPVADWFKSELRERAAGRALARAHPAQGIFDPAEVKRLVSEHLSGRRDHRKQLWTLFIFQLWHRRWVEERLAASPRGRVARRADAACGRRVKPSLVDDLRLPALGAIRSGSSRGRGRRRVPASSSATAAAATGRSATASRGSFRPISSSSSAETAPRSAGSGSTSPSCTPSSRRSSSTGSIRSIATFFEGKRVLDAGCGTGRHAYLAAPLRRARGRRPRPERRRRGCARQPRGASTTSTSCRATSSGSRFAPRQQGGGFDLIYSIGVLHHLPDPHAGFRSLLPYLRPGGTIAVWLYGHENNGFVRNAVEPLRRVDDEVPRSALRAVAWPLAAGFHAAAKGVYRPLDGTRVGRSLPLDEYMSSVADFSFRQNYGIVFDQLSAPTAAYIRREELEQLVRGERAHGRADLASSRQLLARQRPRRGLSMAVNEDVGALLELLACPSAGVPSPRGSRAWRARAAAGRSSSTVACR